MGAKPRQHNKMGDFREFSTDEQLYTTEPKFFEITRIPYLKSSILQFRPSMPLFGLSVKSSQVYNLYNH